ncbi:class I SAM-dependent methyltransferase [Nocardia altamirensis]|uniref:class I SAM-dependent methyltransferase n=1 Tax=Nocardia altamirensis TaxID=472158 RepID=UPI0008406A7D|nr:class I SAM-dependent methyltransferase [Nocardia altamirensis]
MPDRNDVDQQDIWDQLHRERAIDERSSSQVELSTMLLDSLHPHAGKSLLELGCGQGADSVWFAERGVRVCAADFSGTAIHKAERTAKSAGVDIEFRAHDLSSGQLPVFGTDLFDAVYGHLSLHYFTTAATTRLVAAIARALQPEGFLAFAVKSVNDRLYGEGEELGENTFRRHGHLRHFFSTTYVEQLLADWEIRCLDERSAFYQSAQPSSIIHVLAKKRCAA